MNKAIRTYDELLEYKKSLQEQLNLQRQLIYEDINEIKEELKPASQILTSIGKFLTPRGISPLLASGTNTLVDLFLRRGFLRKPGWLSRAIILFAVSKISSYLFAGNKNGTLKKAFSVFSNHGKK
jgi:hypothetical protein